MSCQRTRSELCAYHFGVVLPEARRAIDAHLLGCNACLREFLELKGAVETGEGGPAPAPAVRDRLRRAVARELAADAPRPWAWWERPVAFAFAGSAVLMAMMAVRVLTSGPGAPPHALSSGDPAGSNAAPR